MEDREVVAQEEADQEEAEDAKDIGSQYKKTNPCIKVIYTGVGLLYL